MKRGGGTWWRRRPSPSGASSPPSCWGRASPRTRSPSGRSSPSPSRRPSFWPTWRRSSSKRGRRRRSPTASWCRSSSPSAPSTRTWWRPPRSGRWALSAIPAIPTWRWWEGSSWEFRSSPPRPISARGTLQAPERKRAAVIDTGVLIPLGLSVSGLLSHQLNVTTSWLLGHGFAAVVHGEYQLNVELGDRAPQPARRVGGDLPQPRAGYYGAVGLGFVFSAAGGGAF